MSFLNDFEAMPIENKPSLGVSEARIILSDIHLLALKNKTKEIEELIKIVPLSEILNPLFISATSDKKGKSENIEQTLEVLKSIIKHSSTDIAYLLLDEVFINDKNIHDDIRGKVLYDLSLTMYEEDSVLLFKAYHKYRPDVIKKAKELEDIDIANNKNRYSDTRINLDYELGTRKIMKQIMEYSSVNILKFVLKSKDFKNQLQEKEQSYLESDVLYYTTWCVNHIHRYENKSKGKSNESLECALLVWDNFPNFREQLSKSLLSGISSLNKYHDVSSMDAKRSYESNVDFYDTLVITGILDFNGLIDNDKNYSSYENIVKDYFGIPQEKLVLFEQEQLQRNIGNNNSHKKQVKI